MNLKAPQNHSRTFASLLLSGGAWAFCGKIITAAATLVVNASLARLLSPDEMGIYFLAFSFVYIAVRFAILGMNQTVLRLIAESMATDQIGRALKSILYALLLGGTGVLMVSLGILGGLGNLIAEKIFHLPMLKDLLLLIAIWMGVITFQHIFAEIYRGFHDIRFATVFGGLVTNVLCALIFTVLKVLNIDCQLEHIVFLSILAGAISLFFSALVLYKKLYRQFGKTITKIKTNISAWKVVKIGSPLWVANLALIPRSQAALWILGMFRPQSEVAMYGASLRLVTMVSLTLIIVNAVIPPIIAEMSAQGRKRELEKIIRTTTTFIAIPAIIILTIFIFSGGAILVTVYGDFYRSGAIILSLLSIGQLVNVCCGSCGQALMMTGHQKILMWISLLSGFSILAISVLFVKIFGATGIAAVVMVDMIIYNLLMVIIAKKRVGIWTTMTLKTQLADLKRVQVG